MYTRIELIKEKALKNKFRKSLEKWPYPLFLHSTCVTKILHIPDESHGAAIKCSAQRFPRMQVYTVPLHHTYVVASRQWVVCIRLCHVVVNADHAGYSYTRLDRDAELYFRFFLAAAAFILFWTRNSSQKFTNSHLLPLYASNNWEGYEEIETTANWAKKRKRKRKREKKRLPVQFFYLSQLVSILLPLKSRMRR